MEDFSLLKHGRLVCLSAFALCACSGNIADESSELRSGTAPLNGGNFLITYKQTYVPNRVAIDVALAGGSLIASYGAIGIAVASSSSPTFAARLALNPAISSVVSTAGAGVPAFTIMAPTTKAPPPPPPGTSGEPFAGMQWNMDQIHASEARAINPGRKSIVIGVLDSGIDDTVPDLQGQVDHARSVTCIGGAANTDPAAWSHDGIGHGTYVAGIIGAKQNGIGVVGVAPGATLAAIKVTDDGFVYPESVICGLNWAANHGFSLVNASIFTDPWYYNCPSDPTQSAILTAMQRAVDYAAQRNITVIASTSNEDQDLANPTVDPFSPTDGTPTPRPVTSACQVLPVGLNGVIGVSAVGGDRNLAFYSNYGLGVADLTAPGGDQHVPVTGNPSGQILSDIPSYSFYYQIANNWNGRVAVDCTDGLDPNDPNSNPATCAQTYALLQGTSASAPHVAGVAALALSQNTAMRPADLLKILAKKATPLACPPNPYQPYPTDMPPLTCQTGTTGNGFYGAGEVDALAVVR